ncbi:hypothetical protein KC363_g205 [Hortaea werneckii]|uniref:Cytidyltransferase-like domain-containing protein n=1 Tax=Hortaea werneckii TaxID=91943 RepID=A0A3M7FMX8_HORWE|nr:hypothetical protein KC361_g324 [Hortaea werneckii]KAI7197771.1 hypothetical protein KC363_g205 [Hortaea werneckii]RMY90250.1 hypothetical protein D0861_03788 [Hortaea werneckii]
MVSSDDPPRFICFLPPVPSPPSLASLKAAFGDTIGQVLKEVASHSSDSEKAAVLELALACPELLEHHQKPHSALYQSTQTTLAAIYKLICVIAAQEGVNVEDADGVDVRVLLVAWSPSGVAKEPQSEPYGPVIDLHTLAVCGRQWQYAFGVESEAGEAMVRAFVEAKGSGESMHRLQSGLGQKNAPSSQSSKITSSKGGVQGSSAAKDRHYDVAVGGTFDHTHIGHKLLLTMTLFAVDEPQSPQSKQRRSATIGIAGDQLLVNKKHADVLESWDQRQKVVQDFVDSLVNFTTTPPQVSRRNDSGPNGNSVDLLYPHGLAVKCTEIQDPFGPTITEEQISALIISAETRSGGKAVNDKRKEKGWKDLEVFEVDVLDAEAEGQGLKEGFEGKLSSTAIREKIARKVKGESAAL